MSNRFQPKDFNNFNGAPFQLYENNNVINDKGSNMSGNFTNSNLSDLYYSQSNINLLQEKIIKGVYKHPDTYQAKISKQSEDELLIIMRSIFLQHCKHQPHNIQQQIQDLNKLIIDYCIPNIVSAIKQYNGYIHDITKKQTVMDKPSYVSIKGEKTLMPRHFI
jgi:hypothetical protein